LTGSRRVALSRDPRARDHEVEVSRVGQGLAAANGDPWTEFIDVGECVRRPLVGGDHARAAVGAKPRCALPGYAESEYEYALSCEVERCDVFSDRFVN
jgi:hypothetical protein